MNRAVIALGSNIDPKEHVAAAQAQIAAGHRLLGTSRFVITQPIGPQDQPSFLNGCVLIETDMGLESLRQWLKDLEDRLGRVRTSDKFGPRTIDLDVVAWNGQIVDEDVYSRDFLQEAVRELLPTLCVERTPIKRGPRG